MCKVTDKVSIRKLAIATISDIFKDADGNLVKRPIQEIFPILNQLSDSKDPDVDKSFGIFNRFVYVLTEYPDLLGINRLNEMSAEDCCEIFERLKLNLITFAKYIQLYQQYPKLLSIGKEIPSALDAALTKMENDAMAMAKSIQQEIDGFQDFISTYYR